MGATVLLVDPDGDVRDRIAEWLEEEGHEVITCPGPGAPGYDCIGSRVGRCPLANAADVVVLDLWLASDTMLEGAPASGLLLSFYRSHGLPVVGIVPPWRSDLHHGDRRVRLVSRPAGRDDVTGALRAVLAA